MTHSSIHSQMFPQRDSSVVIVTMSRLVVFLVLLFNLSKVSLMSQNVDWVRIIRKSQDDYKSSLMQQIFLDTPLEYKARNLEMEIRLRCVEERLRSLEQPLWRIDGVDTWNQCSNGGTGCQCDQTTKRISCWRSSLKVLPPNQIVPSDVQNM